MEIGRILPIGKYVCLGMGMLLDLPHKPLEIKGNCQNLSQCIIMFSFLPSVLWADTPQLHDPSLFRHLVSDITRMQYIV